MDARPLPSAKRLRELFILDETSGVLVRKATPDMLPRIAKRFAGKPAGHVSARGYVQVLIDGVSFLAHRIVWKMVHGTEPDELDHINGLRSDNRPGNLRPVSRAQNLMNRSRKSRKAFPKGVHQTAAGTFKAEITANGVRVRLGTFTSTDAAHAAYREAARSLHGAFARFD